MVRHPRFPTGLTLNWPILRLSGRPGKYLIFHEGSKRWSIMYAKCIKCGSEKTHSSRVRPGERTTGMLFLRPIRCHECKERFWVRNPNAYLAAGAVLGIGAMLITTVWLVIEQNLGDHPIMAASKTEAEQAGVPGTDKPIPNIGEHLNPSTAEAKPPGSGQPAGSIYHQEM